MATNHYFNNFSPAFINEQRLMDDLVCESIKIHGHDIWYIPRTAYDSVDQIFGEMVNSKFTAAYKIEVYIANVAGYDGDGDFFTKFGIEIRDNANFVMSRRSFERYVPSTVAGRPREGDLLYVPLLAKIFEIKFVEDEKMFFSMGNRIPYIYELRTEAFRYSHETIDTGIDEIDIIEDNDSYTMSITLSSVTGIFHTGERIYQSSPDWAEGVLKSYDPATKTLELVNIQGTFAEGQLIGGESSTATGMVSVADELGDYDDHADRDNGAYEDEADSLVIADNNPLGSP